MISLCPGKIIYVDVDDTIIDHNDVPKKHVISYLKHAKQQGCILYLWSQGGKEYAEMIATKININDLFDGFLPKPEICVDDLEISSKFIQKCIHPIQLVGLNYES